MLLFSLAKLQHVSMVRRKLLNILNPLMVHMEPQDRLLQYILAQGQYPHTVLVQLKSLVHLGLYIGGRNEILQNADF